jgi:hypothetical protein
MKSLKMLVPCLFAALLLVAVNAAASVVLNVDIPLSGAVINPCNGETVTFSGVDHFTIHLTFDGAGGFHADAHDNIHITGTGSLGNSYEGNQEDNNPFNAKVGLESTFGLTFSEISKGSAPNFEVHILQHITVNANGTVTVSFSNFTANCRG